MPAEFQRVKDLFLAALEHDQAAERSAYLDAACGPDFDLRQRVEALLARHEAAGSFLESPVSAGVATVDEPPIRDVLGTVIGPYKLMEQIGEGGMGLVFVAEQTHPVRRKVALKLIKPGMDTREVMARFQAEQQALAVMDHPNIARVLDAGTTGTVPSGQWSVAREEKEGSAPLTTSHWPLATAGRPYFVMELVRGIPITDYCDQNQLTPRQRLELFVSVCQAVQHAHQKGIIHRDIKPSNVMVTLHDGTPVVKVIDFGVAKAIGPQLTERTVYTKFMQMIGTPLYMSPEQAEMSGLDIDTRSDIYSLGVLLYELLTGTTPFDKDRLREASYDEIRRIIREEEPPKPSTRISTMGLASTTVSAQRKSDPKRLSKLFRGELDWIVMKALEKDRNRRYETANSFAADVQRYLDDEPVLACPPTVGYRVRKFARRNKTALAIAAIVLFFLVLLGGGAGWTVRDHEARRTNLAGQFELILDEVTQRQAEQKWPEALAAARRAEALVAGGGGDRALEQQVRDVLADLKLVERLELIRLERAAEKESETSHAWADRAYAAAFRDAGADLERLNEEAAAESLRSRLPIAVALAAALDDWILCRRSIENAAGAQALSAVAQRIDSDPWRRQVRQAAIHIDVKALEGLAASADLDRQPPTTVYLLGVVLCRSGQVERGIAVLRQAQRRYPGDFWINYNLGWRLRDLGPAHLDEAVGFGRAAVALRPHSAEVIYQVGHTLSLKADLDEAIACFRKAIELNPKYSRAHGGLGHALARQKKLDEAIASYRTATDLTPKDAQAHTDLGQALEKQGNLEEALAAFRQVLALNPTSAWAHIQVGSALAGQGKWPDATALYRRALALDPNNAVAHGDLGWALFYQDKLDEAISALRQAIALYPQYANAHTNLGRALEKQGKLEEALASYWKALECEPKHFYAQQFLFNAIRFQEDRDKTVAFFKSTVAANPKNAPAHWYLGNALWYQDREDESLGPFRRAIELDPDTAGYHHSLANNLRALNKLEEAIVCYRKAIALNPKVDEFHYELGVALNRKGRFEEAYASWKTALEFDSNYVAVHRALAWHLATAPDPKVRDPKVALTHARRAVDLEPNVANHWSNLGVALLRTGECKSSIEKLEKADQLRPGGDNYHRFFLAMAYWQIGEKDKARQTYEKGVQWMEKNRPSSEELRRFRAEAAELLKIDDPTKQPREK